MTRSKQQSAPQFEEELSLDVQLLQGIKRLARLRSNLKALQVDISEKIINGVRDTRELCDDARSVVGEAHAALTVKNQ